MSKTANVYASSLFELALEENADREIRENISGLCTVFEKDCELVKVLQAPVVTKKEKESVIDAIFKGRANLYLINLFKVMTDRKAAEYIKETMEAYVDIYNKHYNIEKAVVITAVELASEMKDKLAKKLEAVTGKTILLETAVDPNIIGGVVVKFSDTELDSSIANKLKNLREELAKI